MLMSFPYYWYTVNSFWIGSNGYINFSSPANFASPFAQLPNTATPNDLLAICTGDLDFTVTAANPRCLYWTNGNDSLVVSFINVTEWQTTPNPNLRHTFQVILNRADSSITYQYGVQQGRYSSTNNTRLCIGMENATGQIGLSYTYSTTPPHALLPDSGIAIKWKRTVNTGLSVTDVGTVGGFNPLNQGKIIRAGVADTIRAIVRNFGTANLTNVRVTYQISRALEVYRDTVFIPTLNAGEQTTVTFPRLFLPSATGTYTALFSSFVAGDVGPGNNNKTAEIVVSPFAIGQSTRLQFENGAVGGSINWSGGGGMGVAFDLPAAVYPVRIETVFVNISAITTQPMTVQILDGSLGAPGAVLAERIVNAVVGLNTINFTSDSVRIRGGRFFVGGRGQMAWSYELTPPIANRTWEYTGGWAPYRSADLQDVTMRVTVRPEQPINFAWTTQTSGTTQALRCVKTVSPDIGWIGGAAGTVLRTTNGGTTWSSVGGGPMAGNTVYAIEALSATTALVTTSPAVGTYIFRTTNGGTSWDTVYAQAGGFIDALKMYDANNGIAIGDPVGGTWTIVRTTNGGSTWARIATEPPQVGTETGFNTSASFVGTSHIWFGTNNSRVYRSTDAGATWSSAPVSFASGVGVGFADTQVGIAGGSGTTGAARSTDGGATWSAVTLPGSGSIYGITGRGPNFWAVRGTVVVRSINQGANWDTAYAGTIGAFRHLDFGFNTFGPYGWAVTGTGGIVKYAPVFTGVGDSEDQKLPQQFALSQNYPNPFNPTTTILYSLPQAAQVKVSIYNMLGQRVVELANEVQPAGSHQVVWDARNSLRQHVASGVYFYRLEARPLDGSAPFTSIRKMLFLK
jgi:photosystem II stability/assembly factor-like uncharacterized protein